MFSIRARSRATFATFTEHRWVTSAVLVDTIGAGLTLPLTIVYFTLTTDLSLALIGVLSTAASLLALPVGLLGGVLTDRFGAKASMITNNLTSAAGFALYLVAHDPVVVFAAIFLANASERLYWTSWTAYVHDLSDGRPFERWFAFLEATKAAALGAGAVVAAVTLAGGGHEGLRWLVLANVVTSVAAAVVFATRPTGGARTSEPGGRDVDDHRTGSLREFAADRSMRLITLGQFLIGPAMVLPNVALSVLFVERWHMPAAVAPVQFAVATGLAACLQTSVTRWVAGFDRGVLVAVGAGLTALAVVPLVVLPPLSGAAAWSYVVAVAVLIAAADMVALPAANAVMAEAPHPAVRGRAIGVFQTAGSVGMAVFPLSLALLDTDVPWLLWAVTALVFAGAAWAWRAAVAELPARVRVATAADADG
ncbi:MFS transporter [Curtobacterium pusillum]|uniref:MFS transporter n=1 Tax=Curtobacterium pusillum TaxID=69373 RepID=UPI001643E1B1|nr:MFS transporter [Curtobacterium pusillum]